MRRGAAVDFQKEDVPGSFNNEPFVEMESSFYDRLGESEDLTASFHLWKKEIDRIRNENGPHRVGGQPRFIQYGPRDSAELLALDRVLLSLGFDDDICFRDAGQLNLLIGESDLKHMRFERAYCTWDCG